MGYFLRVCTIDATFTQSFTRRDARDS